MAKLTVVEARVTIRTFAEGFFSRLAHDLELGCRKVSGTFEDEKAVIEVRVGDIDVNGTLKDGHVHPNGLSNSDRNDCLEKMRKDVFHANAEAILRVEGTRDGRVRVIPPRGTTVERTVALKVDGQRVTGSFSLSLAALGSDVVKGPMNAFRVKDVVDVAFDVTFA